MKVLTTKVKRPRVKTIAGNDKITTSGRTTALTKLKTSAATKSTPSLSPYEIPVKSSEAAQSPKKFTSHRKANVRNITPVV